MSTYRFIIIIKSCRSYEVCHHSVVVECLHPHTIYYIYMGESMAGCVSFDLIMSFFCTCTYKCTGAGYIFKLQYVLSRFSYSVVWKKIFLYSYGDRKSSWLRYKFVTFSSEARLLSSIIQQY